MSIIRNKLYYLLSSKKFRSLAILFMVIFLTGCEDIIEPEGQAGNYNSQANCWQTKITHAVTKVVDSLYHKGVGQAMDSGANVVLVGFAVWLGFKLLKVLASFKEESVGEVWNEIFQKLFVCAFCAYFLGAGGEVGEAMSLFVIPIYSEMLNLGIDLLSNLKNSMKSIDLSPFGTVNFAHGVVTCPAGSGVSAGGLQSTVQPLSDCMICNINARLNGGIKVGIGLISTLSAGPIIVGLVMIVLFTLAKFGFVLYVVDSLFRLNFAAFLLPLLIAGVPFSYTRKWSKHGLLMFLNSAGCMLFIGLLIGIAVGALENIYSDLVGEDAFDPKKVEGVAGSMLLSMVLISLLVFNIPGQGVSLSDKFVGGGGGLVFAKKVSKFIINSVKAAGAAVLAGITGGASAGVSATAQKFETSMEVMHNMKQKIHSASRSLNSVAGRNDDD